jgi:hypothetical protein
MKRPSQKLLLTALAGAIGIAAMLTTPALAQDYQSSHHERYARSPSAQQWNSDIPYYGNAPYDQRDDW